jgi:hypothetical protein
MTNVARRCQDFLRQCRGALDELSARDRRRAFIAVTLATAGAIATGYWLLPRHDSAAITQPPLIRGDDLTP